MDMAPVSVTNGRFFVVMRGARGCKTGEEKTVSGMHRMVFKRCLHVNLVFMRAVYFAVGKGLANDAGSAGWTGRRRIAFVRQDITSVNND